MKAAISSQGILRTLLGVAALLTLVLLGVAQEDFSRFIGTGLGRAITLLSLIFLLVWSIGEAARDALNEYIEKSDRDHYNISEQARKERAFRNTYLLWREGSILKTASADRQQEWERRIIKELSTHSGTAIKRYFFATGRTYDNATYAPVTEQQFNAALVILEDFIKEDFRYTVE